MVYPHSYRTEHSETKTSNSIYGEYYLRLLSNKVPIQPPLLKILQYVDSNREVFKKNLSDAIEIKSVSGCLEYRDEVINMIKFTENWLKRLGIKYECFNIGYHELEGKQYRLPPVILGQLGTDPKKKTVGVYSYIDVKLPELCKWQTDPWKVTMLNKNLYGNGVAGGKGALICWFHVVQAFLKQKVEIPVNLKFIIESMYQHTSEGFDEFLSQRKQDFLYNIDCIVFCDSEWIGEKIPCIVYGTVGILHFQVTIEKTENSTTEPKDDMVKIFKTIVDKEDHILIPNFNNYVQQITPDEENIYEDIRDFDIDEVRPSLPPHQQKWDKVNLLMHYWRLPSIYLNDIQECICEKKDFSKVKRHFIIKIVPRQMVERSIELTKDHIDKVVKESDITNKIDFEVLSKCRPWLEDIRSGSYEAARVATMQIYKENPNMIKEDTSRVIVTILQRISEKSILLLPLGRTGLNIGQDNENIPMRNFYEGTKLLAAYLFQIALIKD